MVWIFLYASFELIYSDQINVYLAALIAWTQMVPQFETLKHDDRVYLAQASWNEIVIADVAHRSIDYDVSVFFLLRLMVTVWSLFLSDIFVHFFLENGE